MVPGVEAGRDKPIVLQAIQQDTTPTLIARQLRRAIATGQLAPGEQLMEAALARSLGVSRAPLREALQRLTQEGLLIGHRNRGVRVMELDEDTVRDIYLARGAVERAAIEQIGLAGRAAEAIVLSELFDGVDEEGQDPSSQEISELDMSFHEKLVELSGSPRLQRMHRTLLTQVRMCLTHMQATYESIDHRVNEHRALAEAIIAGDTDRAVALLRAHMDDGMNRLLRGATSPA
ncbi:GntR family transcriptional regulator [Microbacterium sp.]|uniref:GntR family transcriptional regulator n=1 Tax=Microbacterium sp. TaxID=51671 RepID=UPI0039E30813